MPPAASGGLVLLQTLNILENFNIKSLGHNSAAAIHYLSESIICLLKFHKPIANEKLIHNLGSPGWIKIKIRQLLGS